MFSIEIFKVHTFFNMSTTSQAFFFYITLKRTLFHEEWYQFHFSTMICVGITPSVAFFLSTTVLESLIKEFRGIQTQDNKKSNFSSKNGDIIFDVLFNWNLNVIVLYIKFQAIIYKRNYQSLFKVFGFKQKKSKIVHIYWRNRFSFLKQYC